MRKLQMKAALILLAVSCAALESCDKNLDPAVLPDDGQIIIRVDDGSIDMNATTKVTAISAVPSQLYWLASTGAWKSESVKYASSQASVSAGKIATGKYQTLTPTAYNYYLSNAAMTFASGGSTISASNTTDVIAGCTTSANNTTSPSVTLEHVFARTGSFTCNTQSGYAISNISWKIASKSGGTGGTGGTYNIATKAWSGVTALASQTVTDSSDLYCTPGVYTITVTYTLTKGDYTETFTKSGDATFVAGKVNNITCTAVGGNAQEISISVSLSAWGTNPVTITL